MSHPTSVDELNALATANTRIEGYGLDVVTVAPCPFCGAPDWMRLPILDPQTAMAEGAECSSCERSAKAIIKNSPGSIRFEIVQTGGPAQPDWLQPAMRRVDQ